MFYENVSKKAKDKAKNRKGKKARETKIFYSTLC